MLRTHTCFYRLKLNVKFHAALTALLFVLAQVVSPYVSIVHADTTIELPEPGSLVGLSESFAPAIAMGINIYPDNPLKFDFIIDRGQSDETGDAFEQESKRLIRYFLASLTIPEDEMWVNLSPYEKDRIIPDAFGRTTMGRDMLALDYMLKQLSSSLMHPDQQLGSEFWKRVYSKAYDKFGSADIPMNTFNKIWIVPEQAVIYEHANGAFIVESHLKVMLEEDYLALNVNQNSSKHGLGEISTDDVEVISGVSGEIVREVLIPEIEKEINQGKTFANLRQIYHSMLLATWYKNTLRETVLSQVYVDQKRTQGVEISNKEENQEIYDRYVAAFEAGVFNFIKEEVDPATQELIPRKYFSGGVELNGDQALLSDQDVQRDPVIRQRVFDLARRTGNAERLTFGLTSESTTAGISRQLNFESLEQSNIQVDNAMLADVRGFASEYQLDETLVQAILINNIRLEPYLEGVLERVRSQNPQTVLTTEDIRRALTDQGVVRENYLSLNVMRDAVEITEPARDGVSATRTYSISGIDYSSLLLRAIDTDNFSRQLNTISRTADFEILPELISRGYITEALQQQNRNFAALNYVEKFQVNQLMEAEGISRSQAVERIIEDKQNDERQRVAIRSMDHAASAYVDPFASLGQVGGLLSVLATIEGYSGDQRTGFTNTAKEVDQFKQALQEYARVDPRKADFDYNRIFDFQEQWVGLRQKITGYLDLVAQFAQIQNEDTELNTTALRELNILTASITSDIDGQIAFGQGSTEFNRQTVNLGDTVESAIAAVTTKRGFPQGFVRFNVNVQSQDLNIDVNPDWVGLIVSNLVNNAYDEIKKQVDAGERTVFQAGDIRVNLNFDQDLNVLNLVVQDTAGGIAASSDLLSERLGRQRIFEYGRTEGKAAGTGTGLAEVFHIAKLMNWNVALTGQKAVPNTNYSGAEFKINIPVQTDNAMLGKDVGGIDLNVGIADLKISQEGGGFVVPTNIQPILDSTTVDGFSPVIINIAPIQNLPLLLGFTEESEVPRLSTETNQISANQS